MTVLSFSPKIALNRPFFGRGEYAIEIRGEISVFSKLLKPGPWFTGPPRLKAIASSDVYPKPCFMFAAFLSNCVPKPNVGAVCKPFVSQGGGKSDQRSP